MGVKQILDEWLIFRRQCIKRQCAYDLEKKREKHHLLTGLSKILLDIDRAIKIVRETPEDNMVIPNLMEGFDIDEVQAEYVAEIKLRNLNKEYILKRTDEIKNLQKEMAELHEILKNEDLVDNIIIGDLQEVSKKYGVPRKTDVIYHEEIKKITKEDLIENYRIKLFLTKENYFKKITLVSLRSASERIRQKFYFSLINNAYIKLKHTN